MSLSSGYRSLLGDAIAWIGVAGVAAAVLLVFPQLKNELASYVGIGSDPAAASKAAKSDVTTSSNGRAEIAVSRNGHFSTTAYVNGRPIEVLVDTGATLVALSFEDAQRVGVYVKPSDFTHRTNTANGTAKVAPIRLDSISVGDIRVRNVDAMVSERGAMKGTLLGMAFLKRLSKVEIRSGQLVLEE